MSLSVYQEKRRFNETPEPRGKQQSSRGGLRFVVQKHDASHVHYDFRLEMEGVLKSWAVPKGPSLRPADKRLAMMVEDHPYDYRNFEGVIPEGNYGGGTVIVWDEGNYMPVGGEGLSLKEQEKMLLHQWHDGNIKIVLNGQKLKGEFALFQMKGRGERAWILVKKNDEYASDKDITQNEKSAKSGKTLVEVATEHGTTVHHPDEAKDKKAPAKKKGAAATKEPATKKAAPEKNAADKAPKKTAAKRSAASKTAVTKTAAKKSAPTKAAASKGTTRQESEAKTVSKKTASSKKAAVKKKSPKR